MRVLWAPWRMTYVKEASSAGECIFCEALKLRDDEALIVFRGERAFAILNKYPYNTAHIMIAPKRHVARPELLTNEEVIELHEILTLIIKAIDSEYSPHGYNIGLNIGRVAGAGIESHLHIHVVPRWSGDTNFMPIIAGTKVIPEDLRNTYKRIKRALHRMMGSHSG